MVAALCLTLIGCSAADEGPPLPKFEAPYVVDRSVRQQLSREPDRAIAWNATIKTCVAGMQAQREIGMFDDYDVTDGVIESYCDCVADEAYRNKTTKEVAQMNVNPESGMCRRYYRPVAQSEIK
ncbi:hypothetical protein [Sphingomonas hankookensis]|uniref:hypothetical protein n=1 Tax=Sphingomonas hankookensis TaxID=563996 RepID=UPI00234F5D0E|nr:hypothetical protein [Sphingomonas hankookensis]